MSTIILIFPEKKVNCEWVELDFKPFSLGSYGIFGFLADVRNYSAVPPISKPRGIPKDSPAYEYLSEGCGTHSCSWLSIEELINFNYDIEIEDRRCVPQIGENMWSSRCTCDPGLGKKTTFRKFLGKLFFEDLKKLQEIGAERIVFCFE